jgi:hypothetical protein
LSASRVMGSITAIMEQLGEGQQLVLCDVTGFQDCLE